MIDDFIVKHLCQWVERHHWRDPVASYDLVMNFLQEQDPVDVEYWLNKDWSETYRAAEEAALVNFSG